MIIWKNCFYNLTICLWRKLYWFIRCKNHRWYSYYRVHFRWWTVKERKEYFEELEKAVEKWLRKC